MSRDYTEMSKLDWKVFFKVLPTIKRISVVFFSVFVLMFGVISLPNYFSSFVNADDYETSDRNVDVYLFYGKGCPHCEKLREFVNELDEEYGDSLRVHEFEIYYDSENVEILSEVIEELKISVGGVPLIIVGDESVPGFTSSETTGREIRSLVDQCINKGCDDSVHEIVFGDSNLDNSNDLLPQDSSTNYKEYRQTEVSPSGEVDSKSVRTQTHDKTDYKISVPIFGEINLKQLSLPVATILIAFMDGFNPCAMWILIFLITMLVNLEDKKRLYILGSVFIISSSIAYFGFLAAWYNIYRLIGYVYWIKVVVGIVAIISGVLHLKNAFKSKGGCHAVNDEKRKTIMSKIRKVVKEKSFFLALIGIISLAISVNMIELVCSAGLPSIYTNLLASVSISSSQHYLYLVLYTVIFMIDDLLIFFIAVRTLHVTGISNKYTKWSSLIGGCLILIIGVLLIFKPEALMFG